MKTTMLTVNHLKKMTPGERFARGSFTDNSFGINFCGTGQVLSRVAVRGSGSMHDRAIYVGPEYEASFVTARSGMKMIDIENIRRLVNCSDEAFALYRK